MLFTQRLTQDMKAAMKAGDKERLGVIRFLLSTIKNAEIDKGAELTDKEAQKIVVKQIKQINDAIEQFKAGGRDDLVQAEAAKVEILKEYLPKQLSDQELEEVVNQVLAELGEVKNLGQVIGLVMKQVDGRADGARVAQLVRQRMGKLAS